MQLFNHARYAAAVVVASAVTIVAQASEQVLAGCYTPVSGFATSVCTDGEACTTQSGVYKINLRNEHARFGERTLVMSGTFEGILINMPNACGAADAAHILTDRDGVSTFSTGPDVACLTGGGDFVNTLEILETLVVLEGTGAYKNLIPGGTVTLTGKLGLKTGVNRFKVTPVSGDELCFGEPD